MKKAVCIGLMVMLGCCLPVFAGQYTPHDIKQIRKAPIVLDEAGHPRMHVVFEHMKHNGIACLTCHHKPIDNFAFVSCDSKGCHTNKDRKSREPGSYFQAMHQKDSDHSCLGCHLKSSEKRPGLAGCQTCHDAGRLLKANVSASK